MTGDPNYAYEYDYENRLIKITKGESDIAEYAYDALGRRMQVYDMVAETKNTILLQRQLAGIKIDRRYLCTRRV
ncbi:MAG: hypothetical protein AMJ79_07920 [Phycisphaerae bacterium SM23_30]|nr:MAG: hypothetical protein AMJ79_07920 [Phycisphaerae bacterium SM23_30]